MVLESTIVCVDNSDFMRNGDFLPSRLHAQQDAVNLVCHSKIRSNSENNVGLISLSNNTEVLVTLTNDVSKLLAKLHQLKPMGNINFLSGIKIAHLVLKHRQGKHHKMRIVAFVGSPIEDNEKELTKLAKRLRKEKVTVDIINFGEDAVNTEKLTSFISAINGNDSTQNSHLVTVPPGPQLSEALITSPVMVGEDGVSAMNGGYMFGVDPNEDPELALALRVSMEEQRAHQEEEARRAANNAARTPVDKIEEETSEEMMLKQALELSLQTQTNADKEPTVSGKDISAMTEEEQMAFALQMSMEVDLGPEPEVEDMRMDEDEKDPIKDPEFLRSILEGLPGVDPQSDAVNNAVDQFASSKDQDKEKDKDKKDGKKKDPKQ